MSSDVQERPKDLPDSSSKRTRRQRQVIVCTSCRRRKIKCDKAQPCSNCTKNGNVSSCSYESVAVSKPGSEYTMELRFDIPDGPDSGQVQSLPHVGQFSLATGNGPQQKKPKLNESSSHTSSKTETEPRASLSSSFTGIEEQLRKVVDSKSDISDQQKNEIQKLKERLEFIENSLMKRNSPDNLSPSHSSSASSNGMTHKVSLSSSSLSSQKSPSEPYDQQSYPANQVKSASMPMGVQPHPPPHPYPFQHIPQASLYKGAMSYSTPNGIPRSGWTPPFVPAPFDKPQPNNDNMFPPFGRSPSILPPLNPSFQDEMPGFTPNPSEAQPFKQEKAILHESNTGEMDHSFRNVSRLDKKNYLLIGTNEFGKAYDTMSFYENYSSIHCKDDLRRMSFGPFSWSSLMRRDGALKLVWDYVKLKKENSATLVYANDSTEITPEATNALIKDEGLKEGESQFERRALQTDGYEEVIPYRSILNLRRKRDHKDHDHVKSCVSAAVTYYDIQIDRELQVIEKIRSVMPKKRVIWGLIDRFFAEVYVYMPYIDEEYFRADVSRIVGPQSFEDEPVSEVNIEKKLDLAIVGILFTVLRLSYLSLLSNNESLVDKILKSTESTREIDLTKYLLSSPINIDIIHVASVCLDQFHFLRRSNFTVLQLAIYLRIYHAYAPEDGDGADGGDSQVLSAVLLQMAYQLGIHREPDENCTNLRINNLSRKIWTYLSINDIHLSYTFGNPLTIDSKFHDTKFPFYVPGGENIRDKSRDQTIIDRFLGCKSIFPQMEELCRLTLDIKGRVPLPKLTAMLSQLEIDWFEHYGSLSDCTKIKGKSTQEVVDRNFKVKTYLSTKAFLISVFFHIYLHYENIDSNVAFFYYKKCLLISIADVMPHYLCLLDSSEVVSDMIINPTVETMVHKSIKVYLSGIIRVNLVIYGMRESPDHQKLCERDSSYMSHFQKLCQVSSCLTRAAEYTISFINKISGRYYYAWRITKSQTIMLKTVTSSEFYKENYSKADSYLSSKYSDTQLQEIIMLCENTLSMFRNSKFSTYGYSDQADATFKSPTDPSQTSTSQPGTVPEDINDFKADKFWFQVLSYKNEMADPHIESADLRTPFKMDGLDQSYGAITDPSAMSAFNQPMETQVDLFSDIPFLAPVD